MYAARPSRPTLSVMTNAPSLVRPPIRNPEPGTRALTRVRPIAFETVRARCALWRDRLALGADLRPAARVLRDMAPFPGSTTGGGDADPRRAGPEGRLMTWWDQLPGSTDAVTASSVDFELRPPSIRPDYRGPGRHSQGVRSRPCPVAGCPLCSDGIRPDSLGRRRVPYGAVGGGVA